MRMSIQLFADINTLIQQSASYTGNELTLLLADETSEVAKPLQRIYAATHDSGAFLALDFEDERFARLNFEMIGCIIVDLPIGRMLSQQGRHLIELLSKLAEEELTLAFVGPSVALTGTVLEDATSEALDLIPNTLVLPNIGSTEDLRTLLSTLSAAQLRLLILDGSCSALYHYEHDRVTVEGEGNVLMTAFVKSADTGLPTARVQILSDGLERGWPV